MYLSIRTLQLPSYPSIEIRQQGNSKHVYVNSSIHVNKQLKLPHSYGLDLSDEDILKDVDLFNFINKAYRDWETGIS